MRPKYAIEIPQCLSYTVQLAYMSKYHKRLLPLGNLLYETGLKSSTVQSYIHSISLLHDVSETSRNFCNNPVEKLILKGGKNKEISSGKQKQRRIMTLPLLKLLGSELAKQGWDPKNTQVVWAAFCISFFTSCRMGEILAKTTDQINLCETLMWSDVKIYDDHCIIHLKATKNRVVGGEFLDIFEFTGQGCCPLAAIKKLSKLSYKKDGAVFTFTNGKNLTQPELNKIIKTLLKNKIGNEANYYSGHSFRAAIPSVLAKFPSETNNGYIKEWGRWTSDAYMSYTKLKKEQKKSLFSVISRVLMK